MAKKKHKAKNSQPNQAVSQRSRKKLLGMDVKDLGAAIAAAVIGEIAQVAIKKANQDSDHSGNPVKSAQKSAQGAVDSVKESLTHNPVQHGASVLAGAVNQINPGLGKLANAAKDTTQATGQSVGDAASNVSDAVEDTTKATEKSIGNTVNRVGDTISNAVDDTVGATQDTAENTAGSVAQSVGGVVDVMDDTVKDAIQEATEKVVSLFDGDESTDQKSKKGKGKKKGKKKNKK